MNLCSAVKTLGPDAAMTVARQLARELNVDWQHAARFVFAVVAHNPNLAPGNIRGAQLDEHAIVRKWLVRYESGLAGRASQRESGLPGTVPDPIIETIIGAKLRHLEVGDLADITFAHRLGMSAENILGLILEEFLAVQLRVHGWHCAWGETVRSVDFVHENGALLQVKNRSNSENSSSSAIRDGTAIQKWYRIKARRVEYMWGKLNELCGTTCLSEQMFVQFVVKTLADNPACLAVEPGNSWAPDD